MNVDDELCLLTHIPVDVLRHVVCSYLDLASLAALMRVSKSCFALFGDNIVWRLLCERMWPSDLDGALVMNEGNAEPNMWRQIAKRLKGKLKGYDVTVQVGLVYEECFSTLADKLKRNWATNAKFANANVRVTPSRLGKSATKTVSKLAVRINL
jgi:hypothetical protein